MLTFGYVWSDFFMLHKLVMVLTCHPFDTLKVRVQTAPAHKKTGPSFRGVYAGVAGPLLIQPWLAGINFGLYDFFRQQLTARWPGVCARQTLGGSRTAVNPYGNPIGHPIMLLAPFGVQFGRVRIQDLPKR